MNRSFGKRILSFFITLGMIVGCLPSAAWAEEVGNWTITNGVTIIEGATGGKAVYKDLDFTYYSPNTSINAYNGGVRSDNCNGEVSNGIIVTTKANRAWSEFIPTNSGVLTVQIGNASSKTGYVNRVNKETGTAENLGSYVPGGSNVDNEYFTCTAGKDYETLTIQIDNNYKYLINLTGSKAIYFDVAFAGNTIVSGNVENSFGITSYGIKFVNTETGEAVEADVDCAKNTYTVSLKPNNTYTAVLTGDGALTCAITSDSKIFEPKGEPISKDIKLEQVSTAKLTGKITGTTEGYSFADAVLKAVPVDTQNYQEIILDLDKETGAFSAILLAGVEYNFNLTGMWDYEVAEKEAFSIAADTEKDAVLKMKPLYTASGNFVVPTGITTSDIKPIGDEISSISAIQFKKVDEENIKDGYGQGYIYDGQLTETGYTAQLRTGVYEVAFTSDAFHTVGHVIVKDADSTKDIMAGYNNPPALENIPEGNDIYVSADGSKDYKTVTEAVAAAAAKNPQSEADRVTIHIAPGTYREQIVINTPYITFINDTPEEDVILTWYYGIGYKYYSAAPGGNPIKAEANYYNVEYAYDKYLKNTVANWGSLVYLKTGATDFKAENIIFEHSFNRYMTEEEVEDGVECAEKKFVRAPGVDVQVTDAKERACAMYSKSDRSEFYKCTFLSDQDTVGTSGKAYFKDCVISGTTDYICGSGSNVFENCELRWSTYTDKAGSGGYITAAKEDKNGYLFKNCKITASKDPGTKGYSRGWLGRPWDQTAKVMFIDTEFETEDMIIDKVVDKDGKVTALGGWTSMSGPPEKAYFYEAGSYIMDNGEKKLIDLSDRVVSLLKNPTESELDPATFFGDWTPVHYGKGEDPNPPIPPEPDEGVIPGNFDGNDELNVNDAAELLDYILNSGNDKFKDYTELQFDVADVNGDGSLTAEDVALILGKVLSEDPDNFEFPRKTWPEAAE